MSQSIISKSSILDIFGQPANPANPPTGYARLFYNSTSDSLICIDSSGNSILSGGGGGAPSGPAGGDLGSTYPNPTVVAVNGVAVPASAGLIGSNSSSQLIAVTGTLAFSISGNAATASAMPWSGLTGSPSTTQVPVQSLTTTGSSGAATLSGGTLNIPQYSGGSGMVWPTGTGIPEVTSGTSWGTTYNAGNTIPANFLATIPYSQLSGTPTLGTASAQNVAYFTLASVVPSTIPSAAQILVGNSGGTAYAPITLSGPVSITYAGVTSVATLNQNTTGSSGSCTGNAATATAASGLVSATTTVAVSSATAPTSGQVLTATSSTAATWQTVSSSTINYSNNEIPSGTINSSNVTFTLAHTPVAGSLVLVYNGLQQNPNSATDYSLSTATITTTVAPTTGGSLLANYRY